MSVPESAIVIGASAGAVEALSCILPNIPAEYPYPILIVVHLPPDKKSVMADLFAARCAVRVKEAEDKEFLQPGTVYFAPPDYHLLVETDGSISLSNEEPVWFSRPSIDVLFETAADAYREKLLGVILTGANSDGARGLAVICANGGKALVQSPKLAYAAAMPEAALAACPSALNLSLDALSLALQKPMGLFS